LAFIGGESVEGSAVSRCGGAPPGREVLSFAARLFHTDETMPIGKARAGEDRYSSLNGWLSCVPGGLGVAIVLRYFAREIAPWRPNRKHGP
jgi:hypothetical protein